MTLSLFPEAFDQFFPELPPLPHVVRYYDDFLGTYVELRDLQDDTWTLHFNGSIRRIYFEESDSQVRQLYKTWMAFLLAEASPGTAYKYWRAIMAINAQLVKNLLVCEPQSLRTNWRILHANGVPYGAFAPISNLLNFLCRFAIGPWNSSWVDLIAQLPYPKKDKYKSVRVGDVFLTVQESAQIIRHIDGVCSSLTRDTNSVSNERLENTCILVCSFQYGFRAKQIAMLEMRNVRIWWSDGTNSNPAVHLTFTMIKQRTAKKVLPMVRKVKQEWAKLFIELYARAKISGLSEDDHIFRHTPESLSKALNDFIEGISERRRGTTDLRHSVAQRMVDAGASQEEVAEALGHSDLDTALVYYRSSPCQAERINRALGLSETYKNVLKIAHAKFIGPDTLAALKGDQQIAGMPSGIPISGIGGCELGQPSCPFNPVMSCYGCPKFMPLASVSVHERVLEDLREVMRFFYASSHAERGSPAFQLESTITNIQKLVRELKGPVHELES